MNAGRLRHRIVFERKAEAQKDPATGAIIYPDNEWEVAEVNGIPLIGVPAEVLTGAGKEAFSADARWSEIAARINLHWFDVDAKELMTWRILWNGRKLDIFSVDTDITGRREWRLRCVDAGVSL